MFSADAETDTDRVTLTCTSRNFGDRSPDASLHPSGYQPKLVHVCFPGAGNLLSPTKSDVQPTTGCSLLLLNLVTASI